MENNQIASKLALVTQNLSQAKLKSSKLLLRTLSVIQGLSEMVKVSDTRIENMNEILDLINMRTMGMIKLCDDMNDSCRILEEASAFMIKISPQLSNLKSKTEFRINSTVNHDERTKESSSTLNESSGDLLAQSQKMFPKVPSELITLDTDKNEMKRLSCAYELLQTEIDYINDLITIIHYHKAKLYDNNIDQEDLDIIFSNIQDIIPANKTLLSRLLARKEIDPSLRNISPSIIDSADSFKVYSLYCANYPRAIKRLSQLQQNNAGFSSLLKDLKDKDKKSLSLESYLIKPVQRICKYPLLIKELQKMTTNAKESEGLVMAHDKFETVVALVNETTKKIQNHEIRINLLSSIESPFDLPLENQILLKKGILYLDTGYRLKERYVILFGNVLLICKPFRQNYILESGYMISDLEMPNEPKGNFVRDGRGPRCSINLHVISENLARLSLAADSEQSRVEWVKCLEQAFTLPLDEKSREINMALDLDLKRMRRNTKSKTSTSSSSVLKTKKKFADLSIDNILELGDTMNPKDLDISEPNRIFFQGQFWTKSISATGQTYYFNEFNHETIWGLPSEYEIYSHGDTNEVHDQNDADQEAHVELEVVDDHPEWRKVTSESAVYYFNVVTRETKWTL